MMLCRAIRSLLITLLLGLLLTQAAAAHATLIRSTPAAGATVETAPAELVMEFTEELDPQFSTVQLRNSANAVVNAGPGTVDPTEPRLLRLALGDLPEDSYTALYKVRSAVDGHTSEGNLPFGIGVPSAGSLIPPADAPDPATLLPTPLNSALRWLSLLTAALAFGGLPFALLVWRPTFRSAPRDGADHPAADQAMTQALRRLIAGGSVLFLLATLLFLAAQAAEAAGVSLLQALGGPVLQLLQGRFGLFLLARIIIALVLVIIAWRLPLAGQGSAWPWWVALALAGMAMLSFSQIGHGAALEQGATTAILLDWLHLAAMVAWLGGLIPLLLAVRAARRAPKQALSPGAVARRFSRLAMICVVLLTLTGIYSYRQHVNNLDFLATTTYGRALAIKLGLFGLLLLLGALNARLIVPRLRALGARFAGALGWSVRIELIAGILLLLAVGVMTSVPPSGTAWQEHERQGLAQEVTVGDVAMVLRVAPAWIGDNEFAVDVTDARPGAQGKPTRVLMRFDMEGMEMGQLQTEAQPTTTERYTARGSFVSMGGRWHVEVIFRRQGFEDVRHTFEVDIVRSAAAG
jgi:copper transport protein